MKVKNISTRPFTVGYADGSESRNARFMPGQVLDLPNKVAAAAIKESPDVLCQADAPRASNAEDQFFCPVCDKGPFEKQAYCNAHFRQSHPEEWEAAISSVLDETKPPYDGPTDPAPERGPEATEPPDDAEIAETNNAVE